MARISAQPKQRRGDGPRPHPLTKVKRKADKRERIQDAARRLVVEGGFRAATMVEVAASAGVATGTIYRYFPSKADLCIELFRRAAGREIAVMNAIAAQPGPPAQRLDEAILTLARRALRSGRLAYALIAEPVDPPVAAERLVFRRAYAAVFARILTEGITAHAFPPQDVAVTAACLVGALAEALVGPLARPYPARDPAVEEPLLQAILDFCRASVRRHPAHPSFSAVPLHPEGKSMSKADPTDSGAVIGSSDNATHEIFNQPPPLENYNLFSGDRALAEALVREGAGWARAELTEFGARLGQAETIEAGRLANRHPPEFEPFDRFGRRIDKVSFHPAWHEMLGLSMSQGLHSSPWAEPKPGAHVARAAGVILATQIEAGIQCPVTMTYGSVAALRHQPEIAAEWLPRIFSRRYDRRFVPAGEKTAVLLGMGMTEKQGGSDLRTNTTRAVPAGVGGPGGEYRITGHKWFFSAPMCDAFLVLAQAPGGLSCFLMPRFTPDGLLNGIRIQRLKDKVGNKSNASSEVEFVQAYARLIGEEGRGIPTIIEMGTYTRLDCVLGTTALMRQAVAQATHHARHRTAFQKPLSDQPLMTGVLADLAVECEAAIALAMRLARAFDRQDDESESALRRLLTPAAKYWVCKRGPVLAAEAMEVLGGNGYVEESVMGRLYREMPVNSIWEGSGNIMCLDVLRAIARKPQALEVYFAEIGAARGGDKRLDRAIADLEKRFAGGEADEAQARHLVERMVLALQGAILVRHGDAAVADAFCASRLEGDRGGAFGTMPRGLDTHAIVERALAA